MALIVSLDQPLQYLVEVIQSYLRKEPQPSQIDPQNGNLILPHQSHQAEKGPISPQNDDTLYPRWEGFLRATHRALELAGHLILQVNGDMTFIEPPDEFPCNLNGLGFISLQKDAYLFQKLPPELKIFPLVFSP